MTASFQAERLMAETKHSHRPMARRADHCAWDGADAAQNGGNKGFQPSMEPMVGVACG